jgi:hypothetical protein
MKQINLRVKVTYYIDMDCEVTEEELQALENVQDEFPCGITNDDIHASDESSDAFEWLNDKCCESAAHSWGYEIEDLTEV